MSQTKSEFIADLQTKTNPDGSRKYTDDQVMQFAQKEMASGSVVDDGAKDDGPSMLESAGQGYAQGATLGALNPLLAGIAALQRPGGGTTSEEYKKALEYFQQQTKAAKEAHPVIAGVGEAASYLGPTGAGSLFKAGTKLGGKALAKAGTGKLVTHLAKPALQTGLGLALPSAAQGLVEGTTEGGPVEGLKEGATEGVQGLVTGAVAGPVLHEASKLVGSMLKGTASKLTGTDYNALKAWAVGKSTGGQPMDKLTREAVQKFPELAQDLADMAKSGAPIPEYAEAMSELSKISEVPIDRMGRTLLRGVREGQVSPKKESDVKLLEKWLDTYIHKAGPQVQSPVRAEGSMIPLKPARTVVTGAKAEALKRAMQGDIDYGKLAHDTPYYDKVLKNAAAALREDLRGVPGAEEYGAKMDVVAQKMQALGGLQDYLGKKAGKLELNAERLLKDATIKPEAMKTLQALDAAFGTNYGEMAQGVGLARQLGGQSKAMSEAPQMFTTYRTGAGPGLMSIPAGIAALISQMSHGSMPVTTGAAIAGGVAGSSPRLWAEGIKGATALAPSAQTLTPALIRRLQELQFPTGEEE